MTKAKNRLYEESQKLKERFAGNKEDAGGEPEAAPAAEKEAETPAPAAEPAPAPSVGALLAEIRDLLREQKAAAEEKKPDGQEK
mgnify:FL=1